VRETGWLTNPYGRVRCFTPSDDPAEIAAQERDARNFPIQSAVADALSLVLCRLVRGRDRLGTGTRLVLPVHDAIPLRAPYEEIQDACRLLRWAAIATRGFTCPSTPPTTTPSSFKP
jgi:DNA polymerase I-like protein with 3'-5' exonuclease and polymerase domains